MSDNLPIENRARTKIVATVGPVSKNEPMLATLVEACIELGLPTSSRCAVIASTAAGTIGVVAAWSM